MRKECAPVLLSWKSENVQDREFMIYVEAFCIPVRYRMKKMNGDIS